MVACLNEQATQGEYMYDLALELIWLWLERM